jgi:protein involved in polysaccharide export with SLBB domain
LFTKLREIKLGKNMIINKALVIALVICLSLSFSENGLTADKNATLKKGRTFLKFDSKDIKDKQSSRLIGNKPSFPFILGPEDVVKILVWDNPELTTVLPVRPDGFISFPLIGDVKAKGLSADQLRKDLSVKLSKFVQNPNVTVMIQEINSIQISITGEVNEPGSYKINRPITLLHIISKAKGIVCRQRNVFQSRYFLRDTFDL